MHLRQTLERLRQHNLTAKPSKCQWGATSLTYLGHLVGRGARVQGGSHSTVPEAENEVRLESVLRNRGLLQALYPRLLDSRVSAHGSHQKRVAQSLLNTFPMKLP